MISLVLIYNSSNKKLYYNADTLAIITGYYLSVVEKTINGSAFNDTSSAILIIIGLSMVIIGILDSKKTLSFKDKFLLMLKDKELMLIIKNKKFLFILVLAILLFIFTMNTLLLLLGIRIVVDTSSLTLFTYTFFPKIISIKLFLTLIFCSVTKEIRLDNLSLNLSGVIFMFLLGSLNYYYIMPYVKVVMYLSLTKLDYLITRIFGLIENSEIKGDNTQSLHQGIYNIITKFPIIGRLLGSFKTYKNDYDNISSPFRLSFNQILKNKVNIYPLSKISKFTTIDIATIVDNKVEHFYSYKGTIRNLELLLKNNSLYFTGLISNFFSDYSNLTCKIHLQCVNEIISINTTFKNGNIEEFNLNRTNLNLSNKVDKKASNSSFYDPLIDKTKELLRLTDPSQNGYNLQVFMQQVGDPYDNNLQQGESSTGNPYSVNRGIKRPLASENNDINETMDIYKNYPCVEIDMIRLGNKDFLSLKFDSSKLLTERDRYINNIYFKGRYVLLRHYSSLIENLMEVHQLIDNYTFENISMTEDMNNGYTDFYTAFTDKNKDIIESNNIKPNQIYPFSKLYFKGFLGNPEDNSLYFSSTEDCTEVEQNLLFQENLNNGLTKNDVIMLTQELKSRIQSLFVRNMSNGDRSILSSFRDINITFDKRTVVQRVPYGTRNEFTLLLDKLLIKSPELFNKSYGLDKLNTDAKRVYGNLREYIRKPLTKEEIHFIIDELEKRKDKYLDIAKTAGISSKRCLFSDLFYSYSICITEINTKVETYKFTRLLEDYIKEISPVHLSNIYQKPINSLVKDLQIFAEK